MAGFWDSISDMFGGSGQSSQPLDMSGAAALSAPFASPAAPSTPAIPNPWDNVNPLMKIGIGMGGPEAVKAFNDMEMERAKQSALQDIATQMQNGSMSKQQALVEYSKRTGDYSHMFTPDGTPAAIQEYNFVKALTPDQQKLYFNNKRANMLIDTGGSQVIASPQGNTVKEITKTLAPDQTPDVKAAQAAATAQGGAAGTAAAAAPTIQANADNMLKTIDSILGDDKGIKASVGGMFGLKGAQSAALPLSEDQRRMQPLLDQLHGQAFLQAYNQLRGGGAITEVEGTKGENAIARMQQTQDPDDFKKALGDLREVVQGARGRAGKAATNVGPTLPAGKTSAGGPKVIDFGAM